MKFKAFDKAKKVWLYNIYVSADGRIFHKEGDNLTVRINVELVYSPGFKYSNGTIVYQGDIVKSSWYDYNLEVTFDPSICCFALLNHKTGHTMQLTKRSFEEQAFKKVGHAFENPEMIKGAA
ncbi:YopX family protein [Aliikangiella coralliicola]|uniref:YopX protein domain-containing protein n=1 Tax=Aliikangiella coralliicola TaxID=2592383 RepID=A0A545U027_9GAMM|nr:YopX family protein [Aliikangiella coralliicola]TQV82817.1 hypothetical protein FLL46_23910 [Aliikangiella coralliicola]